jgi:hypothetical protein
MAEQLESVDEEPESWSFVVPEISESRAKEALADFHASEASVNRMSYLNSNSKIHLGVSVFNSESTVPQRCYLRKHSD